MLVELGVSVIFPSVGSVSRRPFPPRGPSGRFPRFIGYYELLGRLAIRRGRFVSFALALPRLSARRRPGLPGSWGALPVHAPLCDPGGTAAPDHRALALPLQRDDVAFRYFDGVGSHDTLFSGLNHAAYTLAVYASQPSSRTVHARLASGWWSSLAGRDSNPLGPFVKFQPCPLHGVLLTQAFPGAPESRLYSRERPGWTRSSGSAALLGTSRPQWWWNLYQGSEGDAARVGSSAAVQRPNTWPTCPRRRSARDPLTVCSVTALASRRSRPA